MRRRVEKRRERGLGGWAVAELEGSRRGRGRDCGAGEMRKDRTHPGLSTGLHP